MGPEVGGLSSRPAWATQLDTEGRKVRRKEEEEEGGRKVYLIFIIYLVSNLTG
jgi:hypothetical protein